MEKSSATKKNWANAFFSSNAINIFAPTFFWMPTHHMNESRQMKKNLSFNRRRKIKRIYE